ncbi:beta-adaptin, partial [Coemansia sp. RSA 2618]
GVVATLCEHADYINAPEARAAYLWAVGEYSEHVAGVAGLLGTAVDSLLEEEDAGVQLALVNACVKYFLKQPQRAQALVLRVLQTASEKCANPDVRDRAYIYWRLLSADPNAARAVALAEKPPVRPESSSLSEALLEELVSELGCVSSVLQQPARTFVYARGERAGVPHGDAALTADASEYAGQAGAADSASGAEAAEGEPELLISF